MRVLLAEGQKDPMPTQKRGPANFQRDLTRKSRRKGGRVLRLFGENVRTWDLGAVICVVKTPQMSQLVNSRLMDKSGF